MPGKILHNLPEDHRQQIGCMAGIFHIFNRRYSLHYRRRLGNQAARVIHFESSPSSLSSSFSSSFSSTQSLQKESVYREKRVIIVKEAEVKALKFVDSPRPIRKKEIEASRRLSLDESEFKRYSTAKLKEVPRFSLDSRVGNGNGIAYTKKSSIVIKLMGLETLPDTETKKSDGGVVQAKNITNSPRSPSLSRASSTAESPRRERVTISYVIDEEKMLREDSVVVKRMNESVKGSKPKVSPPTTPKRVSPTKEHSKKKHSSAKENANVTSRHPVSKNHPKKTPKKSSGKTPSPDSKCKLKERKIADKPAEHPSPVSVLHPFPPNSDEEFEWGSRKLGRRLETSIKESNPDDRIENPRWEDLGKTGDESKAIGLAEKEIKRDWRLGMEEAAEIVVELERWIFRDLIRDEILQ